jgi:xanthine/CO dehydrogenase XdhC/CoxF family maturation factor
MVMRPDGTFAGMVSGGCLEADLATRTADVIASGTHEVVLYDARAPDDLVWGLGLGCEGLVEILLEPLLPDDAGSLAAFLEPCCGMAGQSLIATVYRAPAGAGPSVGARVAVDPTGNVRILGHWGESAILDDVVSNLRLAAERTASIRGWRAMHEADSVAVAIEVIQPPVHLVVAGTGPDASSLAGAAHGLGWRCTVLGADSDEPSAAARFPHATLVERASREAIVKVVSSGDRAAAVIMSHRYERDREYLRLLLDTDVRYIGVLGPKRRTERLLAEVATTRDRLQPQAEHGRVFGPAGLDIGGEGPELIALAIVAEVAAVMNGRGGGHLRDRSAPIHESTEILSYRLSAAERSTS